MAAFRDVLQAISRTPRAPSALPREPRTQRAASRLPSASESGLLRPAKDYDKVAAALSAKIAANDALTRPELRDAAWCLWETGPALAETPQALSAVLSSIGGAARPKPYRALASSYLKSFDPRRVGMVEASGVLRRGTPVMGRHWPELERRFGLFDIARGPGSVAGEAVRDGVAPSTLLQRCGLAIVEARSGFAKAASAEALTLVRRDAGRDALERLHLCERIALDERGQVIFDEHKPLLVGALLDPFGTVMPPKDVRDPYLDLLLRLFGDPRLERGRWVSMPAGEDIVRRWLTEQSLRQFLEIIGKVADPGMWGPRKKFWTAVYRADLIHDAWVVFDGSGARLARQAYGKHVSFGTFSGSVAEGQAVLLMKIGRGLVAEWSHNGRCNIWRDAQDPTAPAMNKRLYDPGALRGLATQAHPEKWTFQAFTHDAPGHRWREKVVKRLHDMTNFSLDPKDYK